jgi:hypothetical protein
MEGIAVFLDTWMAAVWASAGTVRRDGASGRWCSTSSRFYDPLGLVSGS